MASTGAVAAPVKGIVFDGFVSAVNPSTQIVTIAGLGGYGDTFFEAWAMYCVRKANGTTTPPYHTSAPVVTYTSGTGLFIFLLPTNLAVGDEVYLFHPNLASSLADILNRIGDPTGDLLASLTAKWGNSPISFAAHQAAVFHEQPDVSFVLATTIAEQNIFNFTAAHVAPAYGHVVRRVRLYCDNPGVATIHVHLYELEGLVLVARTHVIDTLNFAFSRSLMDMFGIPEVAGHVIQMTIHDNNNGATPVHGSYSWALTS